MQLDSTGRSVGIAVSSGGEEVNWANAKAKAAKLARSPGHPPHSALRCPSRTA